MGTAAQAMIVLMHDHACGTGVVLLAVAAQFSISFIMIVAGGKLAELAVGLGACLDKLPGQAWLVHPAAFALYGACACVNFQCLSAVPISSTCQQHLPAASSSSVCHCTVANALQTHWGIGAHPVIKYLVSSGLHQPTAQLSEHVPC